MSLKGAIPQALAALDLKSKGVIQNGRGARVSITFLMPYICLTVSGDSLVVIDSSSDSGASESDIESMFENSGSKRFKLGPWGGSPGMSVYA